LETTSIPFESYRDLLVWQQAMDLTAVLYRVTGKWPKELSAKRTGFAARQEIAPLPTASESVGKLLRLLLRRLAKD